MFSTSSQRIRSKVFWRRSSLSLKGSPKRGRAFLNVCASDFCTNSLMCLGDGSKWHIWSMENRSERVRQIATDLLQDVASKAADLHHLLESITKRKPLFKSPTHMSAYRVAEGNLHDAGQATTPSWDFDSTLAALSSMIAAADNPTVKILMNDGSAVLQPLGAPAPMHRKRRQGRPTGLGHHQRLDFPAIPFPNQHPRHIATYQRLLARARSHATRSGISRRGPHSSELPLRWF